MMKHTSIVFLPLVCFASITLADSFDVGGQELNVPPPAGYVRVTPDMDIVYRYLMQLRDPQNDVLAYYIPEEYVPKTIEGSIPELDKYFILKVNKKLKSAIISSSDFADLQRMTIQQNKEIFDSLESKLPGQLDKISEGISNAFDIDFAMQMSQIVPLDVHHIDDNTLAYSMYINYGVTAEGSSENIILTATATFLNAAGKVMFLYCYAPKSELEWTRRVSKLWADSIAADNPPPPMQSSGYNRIKWKKVMERSVLGAIMGGLTASVLFFLKKRRRAG